MSKIYTYLSLEPSPASINVNRPELYKMRNGMEIIRLSYCPGNHRSKRLKVVYADERGHIRECLKYSNGLTNCTEKKPVGTDILIPVRRPLFIGRVYQFTNKEVFSVNDSIGVLKGVNENQPYPYERSDIQKFKYVREIPQKLITAILDQEIVGGAKNHA